ncbi:hypothetical protein EMIT0215P_30262 [Pseudomonas serboccidentalis]
MAGDAAGDRRAVSQRTPGDHQDQPDGVPASVHHPRQRRGAQHHPQPLRLHAPRPGRPATGTQLGDAGHAGAAVADGGAGGSGFGSGVGPPCDHQSGADRREHTLLKPALNLKCTPVARELAPARGRSRRKSGVRGVSETTGKQVLGLLRSPAGASSLATGIRDNTEPVGAAEGCDLLIFKSAAAPTGDRIAAGIGRYTFLNSMMTVARGLAPAGLRSRPKPCNPIPADTPCLPDLRALRTRAGASSLATGIRDNTGPVGAAEGIGEGMR